MKAGAPRSRPSWRSAQSQPFRPELWLVAVLAMTMLLLEVWQSSRVAELSLQFEQSRSALEETRTAVEHLRVRSERRITRAELEPVARRLGLAPASTDQVVALPVAYLADLPPANSPGKGSPFALLAEGMSRALVPEATARVRSR